MNSQCSEDTVYKTTQNCTESHLTSRFAWCKSFCNFFAKKSPAPATPPVHAPLEPVRDIEIFAYIRFADEAITFRACLNSLLPTITKGVLVYHLLPPDASAAHVKVKRVRYRLLKNSVHRIQVSPSSAMNT